MNMTNFQRYFHLFEFFSLPLSRRYYNTSERMTSLFAKITEQMIANCKMHIIGDDSVDALWESDPQGEKTIICLNVIRTPSQFR